MIKLIEATLDYEDEIRAFKQEILEYDANSDDRFAGCKGLSES
ncbi:MAG: hypothetical protein PHP65_00120 [Bacilli bacterium]|nr:hypothetical protein [Bacilli bacterium]